MTTKRLGYARVSTHNQATDLQEQKLTEYGCEELFVESPTSGSKNSAAPEYLRLMERVKELREAGEEVEVCVTKLDRFSRSLRSLLEGVEMLGKRGASFTALDDRFTYDAASPMSKLMLQMLGALAEFERSLIRGRMEEGLEAKKAKGLKVGKRPKLTQFTVEAIRADYESGKSPDALAKDWRVSKSLIGRVLGIYPSLPPYVTLDEWEAGKAASLS